MVGSRNSHADTPDKRSCPDAAALTPVAAGSASSSPEIVGAAEPDTFAAASATNHEGTNGSQAEAKPSSEREAEAVGE